MAMTVEDERVLVEAHKHGNREAFTEIVREFSPGLYAHALRRLGDPRAAEDAVQETMLRAYRALPRFNGEYHLRAWLHRILTNVCHDEGNRRRRDGVLLERAVSLVDTSAPSADEVVEVLPLPGDRMQEALEALPGGYRDALVLRYGDDLSFREVADRLSITEENARARVHRGRTALKRALGSVVAAIGALFGLLRRGEKAASASGLSGPPPATGGTGQALAQQVQQVTTAVAQQAQGAAGLAATTAPAASTVTSLASSAPGLATAVTQAAPLATRVAAEAGPLLTSKVGIVTAAAAGAITAVVAPVAVTEIRDHTSGADAPAEAEVAAPVGDLAEPSATTVAVPAAAPAGEAGDGSAGPTADDATVTTVALDTTTVALDVTTIPVTDPSVDPTATTAVPVPTAPVTTVVRKTARPVASTAEAAAGQVTIAATPGGLSLSGLVRLTLGDRVVTGTLSGTVGLAMPRPDVPLDPAPVPFAAGFVIELEDGTAVTVEVTGTARPQASADPTNAVWVLRGSHATTAPASLGAIPAGTLSGVLAVHGDSGALTFTLGA